MAYETSARNPGGRLGRLLDTFERTRHDDGEPNDTSRCAKQLRAGIKIKVQIRGALGKIE